MTHRPPPVDERLWRVRKNHTWIDARLHGGAGAAGVELQFFYDGAPVYARPFPTREGALADAGARLHDLQRAGWTTHW
jgi:hypothetical protein